jgi:hypothetical protein
MKIGCVNDPLSDFDCGRSASSRESGSSGKRIVKVTSCGSLVVARRGF